jgi:hypothetical protein
MEFCTVSPNICGLTVWELLRATLLASRSLRFLLDIWKICAPLSRSASGQILDETSVGHIEGGTGSKHGNDLGLGGIL